MSPQKANPLDRILLIDDLPLLSVAFAEVIRQVNPSVSIDFSENLFTALSATGYSGRSFDLLIAGFFKDGLSDAMRQAVVELRARFGQPRVMIFSGVYDPKIIETMDETGIDAYVHRQESIDEIRKAYRQLSAGSSYISGMFHTLYYEYGYRLRK